MNLFNVVFRFLNKAGDKFVEPRSEDGHGSTADNPSFVNQVNQPDNYRAEDGHGSEANKPSYTEVTNQLTDYRLENGHGSDDSKPSFTNVTNLPTDYPDAEAHDLLEEVREAILNDNRAVLIDATPDIDEPELVYIGKAERGTSEQANSWTIKRLIITENSVNLRTATNTSWLARKNSFYL